MPFNYVIPGQSQNGIINLRKVIESSPHAVAVPARSAGPVPRRRRTRAPAPQNEFSGPSYRVINFVADLPVRIDRYLGRPADDPLFAETGAVVFVLTEFQIIDARTATRQRGRREQPRALQGAAAATGCAPA